MLQDPPLGRGLFACFRERHVKKCSRYHQEWSRGYKNSHNADVGCRSGLYSGRGPKSAIAEISTGVRGADKNTGAPCDATASGAFRQLPDLFPVSYPDLKKEFSEVRSGSEIGRKSHFCPRTLQPQAFPAEASQTMKQSTLRPKSAIAEISTGGRTKGASEIGNCRN